MIHPHRESVSEIERRIAALRSQLANSTVELTSTMEQRIGVLAGLLQITPGDVDAKVELHALNERLRQTVERNRAHAVAVGQLQQAERDLLELQAEERQSRIAVADQLLTEAIGEYQAAAMICARAYRKMLNQARANSRVSGANIISASAPILKLHIGCLYPISNMGTLGDDMQRGLMHWEREAA